jgi:hypothetical protein
VAKAAAHENEKGHYQFNQEHESSGYFEYYRRNLMKIPAKGMWERLGFEMK